MHKHARLNLPYSSFVAHPISTIKQLLSPNATVISYAVNSVVSSDETVPVDVEYTSIPTTTLAIYFTPISKLKKLIPDSAKYVAEIEQCFVVINNPKLSLYKEFLPIKVIPILIEDNAANSLENYYSTINDEYNMNKNAEPASAAVEEYKLQDTPSFINYMGLTVLNPLSSYCSAIISGVAFEVPEPVKLYDKEPKINYYNFTPEATVLGYKKKLSAFDILSNVTDVKFITSVKEAKGDSSTAYVIEFNKLTPPIEGIIMLQPERQYDLVLYYPHTLLTFNDDLFDSISKLIEYDHINLLNINHIHAATK